MVDDALNAEFNNVMNHILAVAATAAYAGLPSTKIFTVKTIFISNILKILESMDIAYVYLIDKDISRLVVYTTGIETDKPLHEDQV